MVLVESRSAGRRAGRKSSARGQAVAAACLGLLGLCIALYVVAYSSKSIAAFTTGRTLFDLATFEQGFWNATQGSLFFYSLEGELSRFGRHFSPIFILMLPVDALHRDPTTLLVLQSLALGLAAVPLYLFARQRLSSAPAALVIAALYLASPVVHDINTINEFHEIAFAVPLLFLALYAVAVERWLLYTVAVLGALMVKEDVALVVAALGVYVALVARHPRIGLATLAGSAVWFVVVVEVLMPALRGQYGPVPFPGYDYLGDGIFGIARGVLTKPGELWDVMTAEPKRHYVFWLLVPVAFVALLAPEVLAIAAPGLLLILASTFPPTYVMFERYAAPVLPFVFLAAVVGVERSVRLAARLGLRRDWLPTVTALMVFVLAAGTVYAQHELRKYPDRLLFPSEPDRHAATAIALTGALPARASVVIEDHRWLAHAAHRRQLYFLSHDSPDADYLLIDRAVAPITNVPDETRAQAIARVAASSDYVTLRCEDGFWLYARQEALARDRPDVPCVREH